MVLLFVGVAFSIVLQIITVRKRGAKCLRF